MKKTLYFILFLALATASLVNAQPTGYYNGTEGKKGEELKATLNDIISGQTVYSYFYSKEIFKLSDADPTNPNNVIEVYTGRSWPNDDYGSSGDQLNREHVWAKSHGNFGDVPPMDSDVHNLKPSDASVNIDKSNLDFDNGGTQHPEATGCYYTDHNWEPRDEEKGDIARIILYMDTRYQGENGELDLQAVDEVDTYPYPKHGKLSTLLQWNIQDPPDDFERNRNNVIYSYQHNRNPFIDNPEFAALIWSNADPNSLSIGNVTQDPVTPHASQAVTIHATITTTTGTISNPTLKYGTSWGNLTNTVAMSGSGPDYTAVVPGQAENTKIYFQVSATDGNGQNSTVIYNFYVPKTFNGTVTKIYDIQGQGDITPFLDQVVSTTGIVTANFGTGYFIQDGPGAWNGLYVYDAGRNPSVGDSIVITGTMAEYYTKTEIKSISDYYFISGNHTLPAAANISCAEAGEAYEGVVITVDNATCTDPDYMANYYMWTVNDGTGNLLVHNTSVFEYVPNQGEVYQVTGPLDYDFDEWKIQLRFDTDVTGGSGGDLTAPTVRSVEVVTSTVIKVQFSEDVDATTSQTLSNYIVDGGVTVSQAAQHAIIKSQVFLTTSQMATGSYNLTIKNVSDLAGNVMQTVSKPFSASFGIGENGNQVSLDVYPNPAHDRLNIAWNNAVPENVKVSLFNVTGMKVYSEETRTNGRQNIVINTERLSKGLYMLEVDGEKNVARTKVLIN
jgi:endonuclease I